MGNQKPWLQNQLWKIRNGRNIAVLKIIRGDPRNSFHLCLKKMPAKAGIPFQKIKQLIYVLRGDLSSNRSKLFSPAACVPGTSGRQI